LGKFTSNRIAQGSNPLVTLLLFIVAVVVVGISFVLGLFAFLALSAFTVVAAVAVAIRLWWAKRRLPQSNVIEGEFHIVKKPKNS